ncbi:MAG: GDP-mannose 4,6-dehydratase, partial [Acidimicrobiales bacterium]
NASRGKRADAPYAERRGALDHEHPVALLLTMPTTQPPTPPPAPGSSSLRRPPMKALVTGASGFVGRWLVAHLEEQGDEVAAVSRAAGGPDLADGAGLRALFAAARPETIYHLAAQSDVAYSWTHPASTFRTNAEGTLNVLDAAAEARIERVLVVSSSDVYGRVSPDELPLTETSRLRPVSPYAASKAAAEAVAAQAFYGRGLDVVVARAFNHLGPGQSDRFVAAALAARVAHAERTGAPDAATGNLAARRDFTDVRDVVRAYRLLVERGAGGEIYNVCSGADVAVQELADAFVARAARPLRLVVDPGLARPVDLPVLRGDYAKLAAATGWAPQIPLSDTIDDVLADARAASAAR